MSTAFVFDSAGRVVCGCSIRVRSYAEFDCCTTLILFCVFFYGLGFALRWPAYASLVPSVLPLSQLQQAFALNSLAMNFARILGPVIAGWTFVRFSPDIAFLVVALISLLSFWLVRKSDIPSNTPKFSFGRVIPAIKEGIGIFFMN